MSNYFGHTLALVDSADFNQNDQDSIDGGPSNVFTNLQRWATLVDRNGGLADGLITTRSVFDDLTLDSKLQGYAPRVALPDRTYAFQLVVPSDLDAPLTINALSVVLASSFGPGSKWGVAVYNSTGLTKLLDTGALDGTSVGVQTVAQAAVPLPAGTYWVGINFTTTGYWIGSTGSYAIVGHHVSAARALLNRSNIRMAVAGNNSSNGICPATLGTLTTAQSADCCLCPWILLA